MAQLNMHEREIVSQLWAAGHSRKAIAERLGRSRSTISRELKRNGAADGSYSAVTAQEQAMRRRRQPQHPGHQRQLPHHGKGKH